MGNFTNNIVNNKNNKNDKNNKNNPLRHSIATATSTSMQGNRQEERQDNRQGGRKEGRQENSGTTTLAMAMSQQRARIMKLRNQKRKKTFKKKINVGKAVLFDVFTQEKNNKKQEGSASFTTGSEKEKM